eukprot:3055203-Rhodomonas_salina.2
MALSTYVSAMQCPVLSWRISLCAWYRMSGTDLAYGAASRRGGRGGGRGGRGDKPIYLAIVLRAR